MRKTVIILNMALIIVDVSELKKPSILTPDFSIFLVNNTLHKIRVRKQSGILLVKIHSGQLSLSLACNSGANDVQLHTLLNSLAHMRDKGCKT